MKRFVMKIGIYIVVSLLTALALLIARVASFDEEARDSMLLQPWQKILFIGDSRTGCTFVQDTKYENCVIWNSALPLQGVLLWLRLLERASSLNNVEIVVVNFGPQSFCEQKRRLMKNAFGRMFPFSVRNPSCFPLRYEELFGCLAYGFWGKVVCRERMPSVDKRSITLVTDAERRKMLRSVTELHFMGIEDEVRMCDGWHVSLMNAIDEICEICNRNQIQLVFFTAPMTSYYANAIPKGINTKLRMFTDRIKRRGVPYYDLREWGEEGDFRDCIHFRLQGAKKFTEWFYKDVIPKYRKHKLL